MPHVEYMTTETAICGTCKQSLPFESFGVHSTLGRKSRCLACEATVPMAKPSSRKEYNSKYYQANREKFREQSKAQYQRVKADPERYAAHLKRMRELTSEWSKRNPERVAAHRAVRYQINLGNIIKPDACQACGTPASSHHLHGHHHLGYAKEHRLDVQWLCRPCHGKATVLEHLHGKTH